MDNKQIKEVLTNINALLGKISVSEDGVFHMSDCRRALEQVIANIKSEEAKEVTTEE